MKWLQWVYDVRWESLLAYSFMLVFLAASIFVVVLMFLIFMSYAT